VKDAFDLTMEGVVKKVAKTRSVDFLGGGVL
jgi:hypothetical protein